MKDVESEKLVRENINWMLVLANRIVKDKSIAEDVIQDAFISAFKGMIAFEGRSDIKTWLHRITINASLMSLRKRKRLEELSIDNFLPEFNQYDCRVEAAWPSLVSVVEVIENEEMNQVVQDKINELPNDYRVVLLLRDIQGYTTGETVELLNISESNVKVRLHRARAALKKLLEPILRGEIHNV
jgi:RNA polymerase sigma-70 factor (ECF subfamily)